MCSVREKGMWMLSIFHKLEDWLLPVFFNYCFLRLVNMRRGGKNYLHFVMFSLYFSLALPELKSLEKCKSYAIEGWFKLSSACYVQKISEGCRQTLVLVKQSHLRRICWGPMFQAISVYHFVYENGMIYSWLNMSGNAEPCHLSRVTCVLWSSWRGCIWNTDSEVHSDADDMHWGRSRQYYMRLDTKTLTDHIYILKIPS